MKKSRIVLICVAVSCLLLLAGLYAILQNYLNSPAFQNEVLSEVSRQLQCDLRVEKMKIRLLRGMDLVGIRVSSDHVHPRDFLKAERLRLRYDLYEALFHHKVVLQELKISSPVMEVDLSQTSQPPSIAASPQNEDPVKSIPAVPVLLTNTPVIFEEAITTLPPAITAPPIPRHDSRGESLWPSPPSIDLRSLMLEDGKWTFVMPDHEKLVLNGTRVQATFSTDPVPSGAGNISCQTVDLPRKIKLTDSSLNFLWRADSLTIPGFEAHILGGSIGGRFKADPTKTAIPFELQLVIKGMTMEELIRTFDSGPPRIGEVKGQIHGEARFEGSMVTPLECNGQGHIHLEKTRLVNIPSLTLMGGLLNRSEFRDLSLHKCEIDFILQSGKLQIPNIQILAANLELTGNGWINLSNQTQEFQMKLGFSGELARQLPSKLVEGANRRLDGYMEIPFRLWGNLSRPQNDLVKRFEEFGSRAVGGSIFDRIFQSAPGENPK